MLPQRCAQVHSFGQDMEVFCASSAWNGSLISVPWKLALLNSPPEPINNWHSKEALQIWGDIHTSSFEQDMHTISALLWALGPNLEGHEKPIKEPTQEPVLLVANFLLSSTLTPNSWPSLVRLAKWLHKILPPTYLYALTWNTVNFTDCHPGLTDLSPARPQGLHWCDWDSSVCLRYLNRSCITDSSNRVWARICLERPLSVCSLKQAVCWFPAV